MITNTIKNGFLWMGCLLMVNFSFGQKTTQVFGKIQDAKTGEGLPFVEVYFVGTSIGVTADLDGYYTISTTESVDSIAYNFLGYDRKEFKIKKEEEQEMNVFLAPTILDLNVATVTEKRRRKRVIDTAAIALWRNVVRAWPNNSIEAADNYYYKDYTNTTFDWFNPGEKLLGNKLFNKGLRIMRDYVQTEENGNTYLPILNKETIQEFAQQKKPQQRLEKVLADRFSGMKNESLSDFIGSELDNVDPFKNVNIIAGKSFVGPFSATSDIHYNYFLTDSIEKEGDKFYLLTFVGRNKQDFTFLGNAWVHKKTFGVESIEMEISPHIALNHINTMNIRQEYLHTEAGYWVVNRELMSMTAQVDFIDIGVRKKRNKKNQIRIRKDLKRYELKTNTTFDDKFFKGPTMQWDDNSTKRDMAYWEDERPEPLDTVSMNVHYMMDSIQRTPIYKFLDYLTYAATTSHLRAGPVEFGEFTEFISWNSIEGVRLKAGVRTSKKLSDKFQFSTYGAYGFKDKAWKYGFNAKVHLPSKNRGWHLLHASYENDFQMLGQLNEMLTNDNLISSLSRSTPMDKLMMIREASLSYEKDWTMGFSTKLGYHWRRFYSVDGGFQFTTGDGLKDIASYTSSEVRLGVHWGFQERYWKTFDGFKRYSMGTKYPILNLEYAAGIKGFLGGEHTYHKLEFKLRHRWSTPIGYLKYQVHAGKIFGDAPYPVLNIHLGNQSLIRNGHAYALMNEFEFVSDAYAALWIDHHFDGAILNRIPLINKLKWRTIFMFKALYGTVRQSNRSILDMPNNIIAPNFYAEIGFGIENIFKMVRIDFMWRMTNLGNPGARPFGINLVINPKF